MPLIIFVPTIVALMVLGFVHGVGAWAIAWVAGGYLIWTLTEYWLHRIVFHFEPDHGIGARLHWIIHGVHHDHPNDPMRLVMPPSVSVPLAAIFVFGFYLVFGSPGFLPFERRLPGRLPRSTTCCTTTCTITGRRRALGKRLRELHMRHHFQDHDTGYGVSAPFWDHVFGTAPKQAPRRLAVAVSGSAFRAAAIASTLRSGLLASIVIASSSSCGGSRSASCDLSRLAGMKWPVRRWTRR